ncbi:MAG: hypothetical protein ACTSRA_16505 [Promethearchaeota archaeon]
MDQVVILIPDNIKGKLVPLIEVRDFRNFLKEGFGSGSFQLKKSLNGNSYTLEYFCDGKLEGMAELPFLYHSKSEDNYLILDFRNWTGAGEAFESLFRQIKGKILSKEMILAFIESEAKE